MQLAHFLQVYFETTKLWFFLKKLIRTIDDRTRFLLRVAVSRLRYCCVNVNDIHWHFFYMEPRLHEIWNLVDFSTRCAHGMFRKRCLNRMTVVLSVCVVSWTMHSSGFCQQWSTGKSQKSNFSPKATVRWRCGHLSQNAMDTSPPSRCCWCDELLFFLASHHVSTSLLAVPVLRQWNQTSTFWNKSSLETTTTHSNCIFHKGDYYADEYWYYFKRRKLWMGVGWVGGRDGDWIIVSWG